MNRNLLLGLAVALLLHGAAALALAHAQGKSDRGNVSEVEVDVEEPDRPPPPPPPPPLPPPPEPEPEKVEPAPEPEPASEPEKPAPEPEKPAPPKPAREPEKPAAPPPAPVDFGDISDHTFASDSDWEITNVPDNPDGQSGIVVVGAENVTAPETPLPPPPPAPVAVRTPRGSDGEGTGGSGSGSGRTPVFRPATDVSRPPEVAEEVRASYPEEARREGIQGTVRLLVLIRRDGTVYRVRVLEDPGYGLGEAARRALERFRFRPALGPDGEPVDYQIYYTYRFVLDS